MIVEDKVVMYVVQDGKIAAFLHAQDREPILESGLQVPAGTVIPGESLETAAIREAAEESGLAGLEIVAFLGEDTVVWPGRPAQRRRFFWLRCERVEQSTWQHLAPDEGGQARQFLFRWIAVADAPLLAAAQGAFAHLLVDRPT